MRRELHPSAADAVRVLLSSWQATPWDVSDRTMAVARLVSQESLSLRDDANLFDELVAAFVDASRPKWWWGRLRRAERAAAARLLCRAVRHLSEAADGYDKLSSLVDGVAMTAVEFGAEIRCWLEEDEWTT